MPKLSQKRKTPEEKLKMLESLMASFDSAASIEEFVQMFVVVVETIKAMKDRIDKREEKVDKTLKNIHKAVDEFLAQSDQRDQKKVKEIRDQVEAFFKEEREERERFSEKMNSQERTVGETITSFKDKFLREMRTVIEQQPAPQFPPEVMQEMQEMLQRVKEVEEKAKTATRRVGGGGITDMGVTFSLGRLVKVETPTGDIDGVNTTYTVTQPIHAIFSFMINGEVIPDADFAVKGNSLVFTTAIPAAYSGKDFEIRYA